ncbi:MAG: LysR family transcriptional regulator [Thiohalocapsa sp.]|nr:LysR family transcriptional regulator [Thiohalocapsa sp.]MCF7989877.1 LysR family transcriptional regulator [Thiohalocapsa sp.]
MIEEGFSVSAAANALYTSQSGVSKQLIALADELGVDLFRHEGKRLVGLTEPGERIAPIASRILLDAQRIRDIAGRHAQLQTAQLAIAASRHAATHLLHDAMIRFRAIAPDMRLRVSEEEPGRALALVASGDMDIGIVPGPARGDANLAYFPIEHWLLAAVVPEGHPLLAAEPVTLRELAEWPICCYERGSASRQVVDDAFRRQGLPSPVSFELASSNRILDYVATGAGVGIVARMAFELTDHRCLRALDIGDVLPRLTTSAVLRRGLPVRTPVCDFLAELIPDLDRETVERALQGGAAEIAALQE